MVSNLDLGKSALERSLRWLQGASRALQDRRWDDVVFSSQMAVELSSKSVLLAFGVEFPKQHDVSGVFRELSMRRGVPSWFSSRIDGLAGNISNLAEIRSLAGYAYEQKIDRDYFKDYAQTAYKSARNHVEACKRLLKETFKVGID